MSSVCADLLLWLLQFVILMLSVMMGMCDREILFGGSVWFSDPDPCGPMGFEETVFS